MSATFEKIELVYHHAASLAGRERAAYLDDACGSDDALRKEVESLLRHDAARATVLDESAIATVADAFSGSGESDGGILAEGTIVGHYRIVRMIGRGGMGVVYQADDLRLGRPVALKLLPDYMAPDEVSRRRLEQEARSASALSHPNICTVYDIGGEGGRCYMAIEYLEGQTLAERLAAGSLSEDEIARISIEVCDALEAAHAAGIVHLDIKPANVFLTRRGGVKVLDFGVAKRVPPGAATVNDIPRSPMATRGTESFMSPEQACGHEIDARADIYALGAVIYTMLAGAPPAQVRTAVAAEPQGGDRGSRADVPRRLRSGFASIVGRAMHPARSERYATVADLRSDLCALQARRGRRKRGRTVAAITLAGAVVVLAVTLTRGSYVPSDGNSSVHGRRATSLAVLPLRGLSGTGTDYFEDGMTEAVIAELARAAHLRVTSIGSIMRYRGSRKSPREVARELSVDTLIDGQVERAGDDVRVAVRQLDTSTGRVLWSHVYSAHMRDVPALQRDVAAGILQQVTGRSGAEAAGAGREPPPQVDAQAYEAYLKANYFFDRQTDADFEKARRHYLESIARDPGFAPAHVKLGEYYSFLAYNGRVSPDEGYGAADRELAIALRLDPESSLAHVLRGMIDLTYRCNRAAAERELDLGLSLNPSDMRALDYHSYYLLAVGRTDEAIAEKRRVLEHDPISVMVSGELGLYLSVAGRTDEAIRQFKSTLELDPYDAVAHTRLGLAYADEGRYDQAVEELQRAVASDRAPASLGRLAEVYARQGKSAQALEIVDQLKAMAGSRYVSPTLVALVYARLGDTGAALQWLARAEPGDGPTIDDAGFASLRGDPRFEAARRRLLPNPECISL